MVLFQEILYSTNQSNKFILIQDDKNVCGSLILNEFIKHNVAIENEVHIFFPQSEFITRHPENTVNYYHSHDARYFLCMQTGEEISEMRPNHIQVLKEFKKKLSSDSKHVVIIDSLGMMELLYPHATYKTLYGLIFAGKQSVQVIALLHTDVLLSNGNVLLNYELLASTNIILRKKNGIAKMTVRHRKHSTRVSESQIFIDEKKKIVIKEVNLVEDSSKPSFETDWTKKDITFKLTLEDKEIQDRSKLILPYVRNVKQKKKSAKIIYEPDASDDWDEEDPDEDLDF